ncbi:solute carrier family 10 (sodium/bile acid cotransporter), member 7 [Ketogulonicigenium robustum]|uniref:Solute carrier family 10 (Sodium/bile acid cotransporter), member 7 n=1 Tax=Ketogulonicigenium robustum TaxID=92947 RepID=A0A1W6NWY9_9RHOB|nr:bile acid:sodium symporter family protein [Ketogulonicigenium robustum]ARO13711.1 solute carrier family 10 (sodium/bile acid cotransporter), member 7 [Ketogulonicigenium robustum]
MSLSQIETALKRIGIDRYMMLLALTVLLASVFPARGGFADIVRGATYWAVSLLFFLYGAKLATQTIIAGFANWRLQLGCLVATFVLFPLLSLLVAPLAAAFLPAAVAVGLIYIGCMPSTVQSSIAFTSVSNGNVAGAVTAASVSNLLGVILSPLLLMALIPSAAVITIEPSAFWKIAQQILLPFVLGQLCRPFLAKPLNKYKLPTMIVDRGSILLIVYSAFSAGVVNGIWHKMPFAAFVALELLLIALLAVAMGLVIGAGRLAGMPKADLLSLFYVGSTKSLATGLPMAGILFAGQDVSLLILPLMLFHMTQLVVCAVLSQRVRV